MVGEWRSRRLTRFGFIVFLDYTLARYKLKKIKPVSATTLSVAEDINSSPRVRRNKRRNRSERLENENRMSLLRCRKEHNELKRILKREKFAAVAKSFTNVVNIYYLASQEFNMLNHCGLYQNTSLLT